MMHDIVNRKQTMIIIQSAQHNEMRKHVHLTHSISISAIAFSWSWTALRCKSLPKRWFLHCSPDIPWHPVTSPITIASSGSGFAVEGASVDGASCWHHGNCLCHTYLLNGHPSQDCWKVRVMMHDIVNRKQTMIIIQSAQHNEMRKNVHLTHSISIFVIAFSWSWIALDARFSLEKVVPALLPWHPLTSCDIPYNHCLFRQRFCSGGRVCRRSILLASWKLPLPHLPFEWVSKSRLLESTHEVAWYHQ